VPRQLGQRIKNKGDKTMQSILLRNGADFWGETKWVAAHAGELFHFAQSKFETFGPGAVILDLRTPEGKIAAYLPVGEIPEAEGRDVRQRVERYNSTSQTVVLIIGPEAAFRVCTVSALVLQGPMN
jgi:hypothetical protein